MKLGIVGTAAVGGLLIWAAPDGAAMSNPAMFSGSMLVLTSACVALGSSRPQSPRPRVDDFGRRTSAAHPWIVPVAVASRSVQDDVEHAGADAFLARCELVAGPCPDPGHPGGMPIALWAPPAEYGAVLVLECFNGTRGPDGLFERLALGVSAEHRTPLAAAAASYGVTPEQYRQIIRRS